jgi:hypothetical protein
MGVGGALNERGKGGRGADMDFTFAGLIKSEVGIDTDKSVECPTPI